VRLMFDVRAGVRWEMRKICLLAQSVHMGFVRLKCLTFGRVENIMNAEQVKRRQLYVDPATDNRTIVLIISSTQLFNNNNETVTEDFSDFISPRTLLIKRLAGYSSYCHLRCIIFHRFIHKHRRSATMKNVPRKKEIQN
jgi:hypothetical protein